MSLFSMTGAAMIFPFTFLLTLLTVLVAGGCFPYLYKCINLSVMGSGVWATAGRTLPLSSQTLQGQPGLTSKKHLWKGALLL